MTHLKTYEQCENPCITAAKKINEEFAAEPVTDDAMTAMVVAAFHHGDAFDGVIWSPNWQQTSHRHNFPTGFQFGVHRSSAVHAALFSREEMFAVQMAFPLGAGAKSALVASSGARADDAHFIGAQQAIAASLNSSIDNALLSASGPSNFCGIFATERRTATGYEKQYYAAARFSSAELGANIYDKIVAARSPDADASIDYAHKLTQVGFKDDPSYVGAVAPHTTWQDLFVADASMMSLRTQQQEACGSLLLRTIHACGLGSVANSKSAPANLAALLQSPALVKSVVNDVDHVSATNKLVYLSEMASMNGAANGLVFREAPQLGVTIFKNLREPELPSKGETPVIGLPSGVGQVHSIHTHKLQAKSLDKTEMSMRPPFVFDAAASGSAINLALSSSLYRQSKQVGWVSAATKFGMNDVACEAIYLKPVVVKVATPDVTLSKK